MSYVLWCPRHQAVVEISSWRDTLGDGSKHRTETGCLGDFEVKEVLP